MKDKHFNILKIPIFFVFSLCIIVVGCQLKRSFIKENIISKNISTGLVNKSTVKPWAYWWWMGSSVTKDGITKNLQAYQNAGFGGMHIIPIYGEKGDEENYIEFLSPKWMDMLVHTLDEAEKLGMQIDMTSGTGWPFGGPNVSTDNSAKAFKIKEILNSNILDSKEILSSTNKGTIVKIVGVNEENHCVDFPFSIDETGKIRLRDYNEYTSLLVLIEYPTLQKVKRSAPGGEGLVIDYFNKNGITDYMQRFEKVFKNTTFDAAKVRSFYNDSYEVNGANYTDDFLEEFKTLRGYDFLEYLNVLNDTVGSEQKERIVGDYCETISDLLYDEFTIPWVKKSHEMGLITRNQAHGSPGNLLDLYAAVDIPETESFGSSGFKIPGVRQDPDYSVKQFGRPSPLTMKFASSAAHIKGGDLVASETTTWLGDHFKVALSQIKPQVDEVFVSGVNHIIFHGITYSPPEKPFPGRLFYASTNYGTRSHFFNELPALNKYIENCQRILQKSKFANDVLLYFPIHDIWAKRFDKEFLVRMAVHNSERWLGSTDFGVVAKQLWNDGFAFDYISDKLLSEASVENGEVKLHGGNYKAVVIPECSYISETTMQKLLALSTKGVKVIFHNKLPQKVNGYNHYIQREQVLSFINQQLADKVIVTKNISTGLLNNGIQNEGFAAAGLSFIRKKQGDEIIYFVSNLSDQFNSGKIVLATVADNIVIYDPLTNKRGKARSCVTGGKTKLLLHLEPGQSCFLHCTNKTETLPEWSYYSLDENTKLNNKWTITPISGAPTIPKSVTTRKLVSWTEFGGDYNYFSGKATYSSQFNLPQKDVGKSMMLNLGDVRETAEVKINGISIGLLWCFPFQTIIPRGVLQARNTIEITVTNLSFNRIIDLDKKGVKWKNFHEINFVNIRYEKYDASNKEPVTSGLLGPVTVREITIN